MRNLLYITLLLLAIMSCKKESSSDLIIKNRFIAQLIQENEKISDEIVNRTEKMTSPRVKRSRETVKNITLWRQKYFKSRSIKNLLVYSDSILNLYRKNDYRDSLAIKEIENLQASVLSSDSTTQLSLLYWDLLAERSLLEEGYDLAFGEMYSVLLPTYLNVDPVHLGDTVYVAFDPNLIYNHSCEYDFSHVVCRNVGSGNSLVPKIVKMSKSYLFIYIPLKKGNYVLDGEVILTPEPGFSYDLKVHNSFQVL